MARAAFPSAKGNSCKCVSRRYNHCVGRIAVIDDDATVFQVLEAALAPRHEVRGYQSGRAALQGLLRVPPQLVLLDIDLGDMSGVELARAIRGHEAVGHIPILAITAYTEDSVRTSLMAEGFTSFIAKPITDVAALVAAVEAALAGQEAALDAGPAPPSHPLADAARSALAALDVGDAAGAAQLLRQALAADGATTEP